MQPAAHASHIERPSFCDEQNGLPLVPIQLAREEQLVEPLDVLGPSFEVLT